MWFYFVSNFGYQRAEIKLKVNKLYQIVCYDKFPLYGAECKDGGKEGKADLDSIPLGLQNSNNCIPRELHFSRTDIHGPIQSWVASGYQLYPSPFLCSISPSAQCINKMDDPARCQAIWGLSARKDGIYSWELQSMPNKCPSYKWFSADTNMVSLRVT